jgi:uncharacterized FlaG/YvyC family protein
VLAELRALGGFESPFGRSSTPVQNPYSDPSLMESDADKSFSQSTLQQTAQKRRHNNDAVIEQREQEINDIAKGIIELADIFKDLQSMVIDQGTMLDRIDYNVERMAVDVKEASLASFTLMLPPAIDKNDYNYCKRSLTFNFAGYKLPETFHKAQDTSITPTTGHWTVHCTPYQTKEAR